MTDSDNGDREPSREREDADAVPGPESPPTPTRSAAAADIAIVYRRAGAYVIDFMLVGFVTVFLAFATGSVAPDGSPDALGGLDIAFARWEAAAILLYRWGMQSAFGFTIGKLILGLRVVAADGSPAGPISILGREIVLFAIVNLGPFIPELAVLPLPWLLSVANLWIALRRRDHRGVHDLPVRTRVIRVLRADAGRGSPLRPL